MNPDHEMATDAEVEAVKNLPAREDLLILRALAFYAKDLADNQQIDVCHEVLELVHDYTHRLNEGK